MLLLLLSCNCSIPCEPALYTLMPAGSHIKTGKDVARSMLDGSLLGKLIPVYQGQVQVHEFSFIVCISLCISFQFEYINPNMTSLYRFDVLTFEWRLHGLVLHLAMLKQNAST